MRLIFSLAFSVRMLLTPSTKQLARNLLLEKSHVFSICRGFSTSPLLSELESSLIPPEVPIHKTKHINDENDIWHKVNRVRRIWKVGSIQDIKEIPEALKGLPQIAVMGRSNTGKSSLINHLFGKGNLAKASSRAGKTKTIDCFSVNDKFVLTDLPGFVTQDGQYSKEWKTHWEPLIRFYMNEFLPKNNHSDIEILNNKGSLLKGVLFLSDTRWRSTIEDQLMFHFIRDQLKLPILLILTKDDKLLIEPTTPTKKKKNNNNQVNLTPAEKAHKNRNRFARLRRLELNLKKEPHLHYSCYDKKSRSHLRRFIKSLITSPSQSDRLNILETAWENIDTSKIGKKVKK
mmetsp:Transcript_19665/g.23390  ORF Transcript_19665/g.23390 Transcript_19665/m.23390 type:complete len:345 (-) Transcript_19665:58-1092(-)